VQYFAAAPAKHLSRYWTTPQRHIHWL